MGFLKFEAPTRQGGVILALVGESGSGKTYSALRVARGFAGDKPFCVLDTEEGRAGHYNRIAQPWTHAKFPGPWSSARYVEALSQIEGEGFEVAVIDQASSEWESEGGVLDAADSSKSKGPSKWLDPKRNHRKFREKLVHSQLKLVIVLLREKRLVDWTDPKNPVFMGMVPIQDPRFVYDATVQLRLTEDGRYEWQKKVTEELRSCFPRDGGLLTEETGRLLRAWANDSKPRDPLPDRTAEDQIVEILEEGEGVATQGSEALKSWWLMLSPAVKRALEGEKDRLKAMATEADKPSRVPGSEG